MLFRTRSWLLLLLVTLLLGIGSTYDFAYGAGWVDGEVYAKRHENALQATQRDISRERDSIVAKEATKIGLPAVHALAISRTENWSGDSTARSWDGGAVGLMQVRSFYWGRAYRDECGNGSLLQRKRNACVGVHILRDCRERSEDWNTAYRCYSGTLNDPEAATVYLSRVERNIDRVMRILD